MQVRQLAIGVKRGYGGEALSIAAGHDAINTSRMEVEGSSGPAELIVSYVPNAKVGECIDSLQHLPDLHVTIAPRGFIPLMPPPSKAPDQVKDVSPRSPIEILLSGMQSVGSWKGFLLYAFSGGVVVWVGLYTNTAYLLVAAMLISPFAGPAMNAAVATARGDWRLLRQSVIRYFASLVVCIAVSAALSLTMRQTIATNMMVEVSQISSVTVVLALIAGLAGASNLVQSDRNSLVSGAAVGMLVAASLAPPAGMIGMSMVIGRWEMTASGVFLLVLQLAGINLAGAVIFRLYGLTPEGIRYVRGKKWTARTCFAATVLTIAALLLVQFPHEPSLQRSTLAQRAEAVIQTVVEESGVARVVEANARFTRASIGDQNTLLCVVYVQRVRTTDLSPDQITAGLSESIRQRIKARGWNADPVVHVTVMEPPAG